MNATVSPNQQMQQAAGLERAGRPQQAEAIYRSILERFPGFHPAWHALGLLAVNAGQLELAADLLGRAVTTGRDVMVYHRNLGEVYRRLGKLKEAIAAGGRATRMAPDDVDANYNLGLAYADADELDNAIRHYRKALAVNPQHGMAWNNLGAALERNGDKREAEAAYARAVAINPQHAEAQNNFGAICSEEGRLDEARAAFNAAIAAKPDFFEAHGNLSSLKTYTRDDPHLASLEGGWAQRERLAEDPRIRLDFALGKALDDVGDYDRAFAAYAEGNRLQYQRLPGAVEADSDAMLERITGLFDEAFFAERRDWQGARDDQRRPIFIVGMPRSGTTLLEQILCSHPSVYGAGELKDLNQAICTVTQASATRPFTVGAATLDEAQMRRIGEMYLESVWKLSPESVFITDKMPANFFYLGLIHLALPGAKIIHAMRDPMDSCFSCFTRLFNDTMEFAYDQGTLGRYYVRYMKMMQHWHKVLPPGTILDLPYEQMVEDTEGQARRVLEFVGLPWDEQCLKFYDNKRVVKTASVAQVRKPIYKSSVARWKRFAKYLQPLLAIVRDYRPTHDGEDIVTDGAPPESTPLAAPAAPGRSAEVINDEAIALYRQDRFEEALAGYNEALELKPDFPAALNNKGFVLQDLDRMEEARDSFARALEIVPEMSMARLNLGMAQLALGDWENGWENYEARWTGSAEARNQKLNRPKCELPQWDGQAETKNKRLLIFTEQGFGDTFQFSRYLAMAAECFAKVGFVCSMPTLRVMEWSFGDRIALFTNIPTDFDAWDLQCPLMSLPRAFKTRPDTIPADLPYLQVPETAAAHWRERLEMTAPGRLRIGIAWAGRKAHQYDARRSLRFEQILPLLQGDDRVAWVSLQRWAPEDERPEIPGNVDWIDWTTELGEFGATAGLISGLDLVISIDSAMVHLAGALNRPVWMLNRFDSEWRWGRHRPDSPWYPSLRIFNQPAFGDWATAIGAVRKALAELPMPRDPLPAKPRTRKTAPAPVSKPPAGGTALAPSQAMQLASQYQSAGRLQEAEGILRQILKAEPNNAHALHLLGVVAYQAGRQAQALELIERAIALTPQVALFHSNIGEMYRQQKRLQEAIRHGEQAIGLDPSAAAAHSNLGIAHYDLKDYDKARACHERALELAPNAVSSLNNLGSIARAVEDREGAIGWYRKALSVQPDFVESLSNLGAVLVEADRPDEAIEPLEKALRLQPDYAAALCNLGLARGKQDRRPEALALLRRSLQVHPGYPEAMVGLAMVLREDEQYDEAEQLLRQCAEQDPKNGNAWCQLGGLYMEQGEPEQCEAAYQRALQIDPRMTDALAGLAWLRLEQGRSEETERLLDEALAIKPDNLGARFGLTQTKKVKEGDTNLAELEAMLPEAERWSSEKRISLHYALGKCYDDLKEYDRAFPHFIEGARLKRAKLNYSAPADEARVRRIIELVDGDFIERLSGGGDPSDVPVFVLGMPRSGTTLTEQIIASHPDVFGAGELHDLMKILQKPARAGEAVTPYPDNLVSLERDTVSAWGREYVERLRRHAPEAKRITDKMPANYMGLGLIPLLLPNAKIVHVRRNPVDTCVSCFTRLFNRHQDATYDLLELGRHYANYARLMAHWRRILPADRFLEVQYEEIVADLEGQARRLIDYCGLPWDDACIAFHKTKRNIRTASVTQVRQPIYNSSVERWRNYENFLGPLLEGLGEFAP